MMNSNRIVVKCKTLSGCGHVPERAHPGSVGYDVCAAETKTVKPHGGREVITLNIAVVIPGGCYGRVVGRSWLAKQHGIVVHDRTIDSDYRGEVSVILFKLCDNVRTGDRIAQLIIE